jgi:2-keto-4-pentenoate hydratase/2-oxohepta-3-ene-1,7-dioic acid hydratase in catechol pathway
MRLLSFEKNGQIGLAVKRDDVWLDLAAADAGLPRDVAALLRLEHWRDRVLRVASSAPALDPSVIRYLAPVRSGEKILCVGLNYLSHVGESPYKVPDYPVFFPRFASTLIGHKAPLVKPRASNEFDYEGELAVIIGAEGRHIPADRALDFVAGYTIFNEGSVRDYQFKAPQWTMGKNFDGSGACGPWFVSADELPAGARGLHLETQVNGNVKQSASTADMLFDIPTLIAIASAVMTLRAGDMIVSGTPAGVGFGRKPPEYLRVGDICTISIEGIGTLENVVIDEAL